MKATFQVKDNATNDAADRLKLKWQGGPVFLSHLGGTIAFRIALTVVATALIATGTGAAGTRDTARTLQRPYDPVVVSTARLVAFPDLHTERFRLFRFDAGRPVEIRRQFDARDANGDVVVAGPAEFEFDRNDELVFMAADAGDRADPTAWPATWDRAVEIEIIDPRPGNGGRAWAYLAWFQQPPPSSSFAPYVTVDAGARRVRSASYDVEYADARNFFTAIRVAGAAGILGENLLRQSRMRGSPTFSLFFKNVTLDFTEQNSLVQLDGVRVGPVRAVRRVRLKIDLGKLIPDLPGGTAYTYHYRDAYVTPSRMRFSSLLLRSLRGFRFENLLEFLPTALPLRFYDGSRPDGVELTSDNRHVVQSAEDHEWWVHSSQAGTMVHALMIPDRWRDWGVARGTIVQPAGETPGGVSVGYTLENMTSLREAGSWELSQVSAVLPRPFRPGDEEEPLAIVRAPLVTEVRGPEQAAPVAAAEPPPDVHVRRTSTRAPAAETSASGHQRRDLLVGARQQSGPRRAAGSRAGGS